MGLLSLTKQKVQANRSIDYRSRAEDFSSALTRLPEVFMGEKKVIAVVGATGSQGGGLVRAILSDRDRNFTARALTRNANSEKAKELAKLGAEIVEADLNNIESINKAFAGAYGAYCVTNYW